MIRWLLAALALAFAFPAMADAREPGVRVTLSRASGGDWLIDYRFDARAPVWIFARSGLDLSGRPWRPQSWTVETPGVRLVHLGHHDALVGSGKPLTRVRLRMRPFTRPLIADYTPVLAFADGGVAIFGDHFVVLPQPSAAAVEQLPRDLNGLPIDFPPFALAFNDPGNRLLVGGKTLKGHAELGEDDASSFVYAGDAPVIETAAFAGVIDSGLPAWVRTELDEFTPQLMRLYADRLGTPAGSKPMALVAWEGAEDPSYSFSGSVVPGMVVMQVSGQGALSPSKPLLDAVRWFIGHESAHFWMGQTVRYARMSEGWITEGSADLLAIRALQALVPGYDPRLELQREMDDCLKLLGAGQALAAAAERGGTRAHYACGALLMLVAEGVQKRHDGGDIFAFLRALIDANRKDRAVSADDWLGALAATAGDGAIADRIRTLVETGVADPAATWVWLFTAAGVPFTREGERIVFG